MKHVIQVDARTGQEIEHGALVLVAKRMPTAFDVGRFLLMSQNALLAIAKADLGAEAYRVFFLLCARLDFENFIAVSQTEIAKELGMKRPNVSRAVRRLVDAGVLIKGPRVGRNLTYRLNPSVGWKGRGSNHRRALDEAAKSWGKADVLGEGGEA